MRKLSILYVDDDPDIRHIVELAFALDPAMELRCAQDAAEALALLQEWLPDAAMLDMMMPGVDGLALLKRLRVTPLTAALPVIFVTARSRPADVAGYLSRGARGVIVKPFDPLLLAGQVRALLTDAPDQGAITR